jgi:hypothetical protein
MELGKKESVTPPHIEPTSTSTKLVEPVSKPSEQNKQENEK